MPGPFYVMPSGKFPMQGGRPVFITREQFENCCCKKWYAVRSAISGNWDDRFHCSEGTIGSLDQDVMCIAIQLTGSQADKYPYCQDLNSDPLPSEGFAREAHIVGGPFETEAEAEAACEGYV